MASHETRAHRRRRRRRSGQGSATETDRASELVDWLDRIPTWVPPLIYAVVTLLLFRAFVFSDLMLFGSDTLALGYMARAFFADALQATGFPLWNPIILGGTPFLESLAGGDALHPLSVALLLVMDTYRALGWKLVIHVFLAGWFMYLWLRVVGISRGASLVGGLAFLLAPHLVTLVFPGHDGKIFVVAMTPILFWAGEWFLKRGGLLPLATLAGIVALTILSTHFQMAYFLFGAMGAYMLFRCVQIARDGPHAAPADASAAEGGRRPAGGWTLGASRFGGFLLFSVIGAGIAAVQLVPAVDYVTEHSRRAATTLGAEGPAAVAYASSWSLHPEEVMSLVVPEFVGSDVGTTDWTTATYWGRNAFKYNHEYIGLVVLLLAALAFIPAGKGAGKAGGGAGREGWWGEEPRRQRGLRWYMLGLGLVALLFTLGIHTPVWRVFYEAIPGISLFRAPSMAIFLTGFAAVTLAAMGVDHAARLLERKEGRSVISVLGGGAAILALGWLLAASGVLASLWTSLIHSDIGPERMAVLQQAQPYITTGFGIATGLATLLLLLWWSLDRAWLPFALLVPGLAVLVTADQWRIDAAFIEVMDYRAFATPDQNHRYLIDRLDPEDPFRVFSMVQRGQDVRPGMHGLELAGGHHPNDLWRYRELIGMAGSDLPENLVRFHPNVLPILNVRFVLWPDAQLGPLQGVEAVSRIELPDGTVTSSVYEIGTLPRARVVGEAVVVGEDETLDAVLDLDRFDPFTQTVLTVEPSLELGGRAVRGDVQWRERTPSRLVLEVETTGNAMVVLSENWFPAWRATVDGEEVPVLRADHTLRAIPVPAGSHRIEMWYEAPLVRAGLSISLFSLLVALGAAAMDLWGRRRKSADSNVTLAAPGSAEPEPVSD